MTPLLRDPLKAGNGSSLPGGRLVRACAAAWLVALMAGCASPPATPPTLFQRLGGEPVMNQVVQRTLARSSSDPRTARSFDGIKLTTLQASIVQHICSLTGGGCHYEGETMQRSHADLRIVASEFDSMVTILREECDRAGVATGAKNELLRLLAPMKRDIVQPSAAAASAARAPG